MGSHRSPPSRSRRGKPERSPDRGEGSSRRSSKRHDDREHERGGDKKRSKRSHRDDPASDEEEVLLDLEDLGVDKITEDDYFLRSSEYRYWLKRERGRYLDELSSVDAHKYFMRFVRRWNDGALKEKYYYPPNETTSTRHQWSFSDKGDDKKGASSSRHSDKPSRATRRSSSPPPGPHLPSNSIPRSASHSTSTPVQGPTLPSRTAQSAADRQLAAEDAAAERKAERKAQSLAQYRRADEAVPRGVGKEGKMEEKRATNAANKEMRDKDTAGAGLEVDEGTLMGDQGGFAAALRARDGAKNRREEQKAALAEDRRTAEQERLAERRQKESETMLMFKAMAKERFG